MKKELLTPLKKLDNEIQKPFLKSKTKKLTHFDKFFKWAPILSLFAYDALGEQSKDKLKEHVLQATAAYLLLSVTVQPLKYIYKRTRPNGDLKSFPSSHTAISFLGSEMLRQELAEKYSAESYAGYVLAAGTGVLRLYHNKHWFSDVLTGALLGVLAAKLSPKLIDRMIYKTNIQAAV